MRAPTAAIGTFLPFFVLVVIFPPLSLSLVGGDEPAFAKPQPPTDTSTKNAPTAEPPNVAETLRLTTVVLHAAGKGLFIYEGEVADPTIFSLRVRDDEASEIIRHSIVIDPAGNGSIQLDGSADPVDRQPRPTPPSVDTLGDVLLAMRGERVVVTLLAGDVWTGTLITAEIQTEVMDGMGVDRTFVTVHTESGFRSFALQDIESIDPERDSFLAELATTWTSAPTTTTPKRQVDFRFGAAASRKVAAVVMRETPLWNVSYVADMKGMKLRTSIDNTTDQDWSGVKLILTSGQPMSFQMDLASIVRAIRPTILRPQSDASIIGAREESTAWIDAGLGNENAAASAVMDLPGEVTLGMAGGGFGGPFGGTVTGKDLSLVISTTASVSGAAADRGPTGADMTITYGSVSIPAGKTALLDHSIAKLTHGIVTLVVANGPGERRPLLTLDIESHVPYRLPPGPLTMILDGSRFGGEAMLPGLSPNVPRLIPFGVDGAVRVEVSEPVTGDEELVSVSIDENARTIAESLRQTRTTTYVMQNLDVAARIILLEHSQRDADCEDGFAVVLDPDETPGPETTATAIRFQHDVLAGESDVRVVTESRTMRQSRSFAGVSLDSLRRWIDDQNVDDSVQSRVREILDQRRRVDAASKRLLKLNDRFRDNTLEINRVTGQLRGKADDVLPADLIKRYQVMLSDLETTRAELREQITDAQSEIATLNEQLSGESADVQSKPAEDPFGGGKTAGDNPFG